MTLLKKPAWRGRATPLRQRLGATLYYILSDLALARWPAAQQFIPVAVTRCSTWTVLAWEIAFPLLVWLPRARVPALLMGVLFHVALGLSVELGFFPLYILCLYLPLCPWERLAE